MWRKGCGMQETLMEPRQDLAISYMTWQEAVMGGAGCGAPCVARKVSRSHIQAWPAACTKQGCLDFFSLSLKHGYLSGQLRQDRRQEPPPARRLTVRQTAVPRLKLQTQEKNSLGVHRGCSKAKQTCMRVIENCRGEKSGESFGEQRMGSGN